MTCSARCRTRPPGPDLDGYPECALTTFTPGHDGYRRHAAGVPPGFDARLPARNPRPELEAG